MKLENLSHNEWTEHYWDIAKRIGKCHNHKGREAEAILKNELVLQEGHYATLTFNQWHNTYQILILTKLK